LWDFPNNGCLPIFAFLPTLPKKIESILKMEEILWFIDKSLKILGKIGK
jgi:hypothetical protein